MPAQFPFAVHASPTGRLVAGSTLHSFVVASQVPPVSQVVLLQHTEPLTPQQNPRLSQVSAPPAQEFALVHPGKQTGVPLSEL